MESAVTSSLSFGRIISHVLPGLVAITSFFMIIDFVTEVNLTLSIIKDPLLLLPLIAIALTLGFIFGLFMDMIFHHRILEGEVYGKTWFTKLLSRFYNKDYVTEYEELREDEDKLLIDYDNRKVSDYYYLPIVGTDVRGHLLEGGVHYEEFFANMFFSMFLFTICNIFYSQLLFRNLGMSDSQDVGATIFFTVIFSLLTSICPFVAGALNIQYRKRKIELIKGTFRFKYPDLFKKMRIKSNKAS